MAVRHGYGKIAGADALVFAYDTGDTKNSYKGEPTDNIVSTMGYAGFYGTSPELTQLGPDHYRLSVGGNNSGLYYSMGVQTGTWVMSYEYRAIQGDPGLGGHVDGTYGRWYVDGIEETGPTDGLLNLRSTANDGEWHKIYRIISNTNSTRNGGIFIQITRKGAGSYPAIAEIRNVQIENKTRPTQYAGPSGTRSATQGLLDLTGNNTIDLSNTGFDSNAQPVFDGTNDHMDVGTGIISGTGDFTVEAVIQSDYQEVNGTILANYPSGNFQTFFSGRFIGLFLANNSTYLGASPFSVVLPEFTTDPIHFVAQREGTETRLYLNGVLKKVGSSSSTIGTSSTPFRVGANTSGTEDFLGDIFVVKAYNRALTAAEIKNNFNNYKGRFNL